MSKYHNTRTEVDGIKFDSKHEAYRYVELKCMQRTGLIKDLQRQVKFELLPSQKDEKGKVVERAVNYIADFTYTTCTGKKVVEDAKSDGTKTDVYKLKKKLMRHVYGIEIMEV